MLLLDVLNEAIEKAKAIMIEKNPEIDPNSAEADQLSKVCMFVHQKLSNTFIGHWRRCGGL